MRAELLSVGTELLLGQIVDTNAAYLAQKLAQVGIDLYFKTTVGDNWDRISQALKNALARADLVITTGGLGPTGDDLTKEVIAEVLDAGLILDQDSLDALESYFTRRGIAMAPNNRKQALIPDCARPIPNPRGTAPGIIAQKGGKMIIAMPGVPREMKGMMEDTVMPFLATLPEPQSGAKILKSRVLRIAGIGESSVEDKVADLLAAQNNPTVAPLAQTGEVHLRITAKAADEQEADGLIGEVEARLRERLGEAVFGVDEETLEEVVGRLLRQRRLTLAVAESCTGGLVAHRLTNIPGSSDYFRGGIVSYSVEMKTGLLGIPGEVIGRFGTVSREVALEMARAARRIAGADLALAVTGNAGPATEPTPDGRGEGEVGLVFIGLATPDARKDGWQRFNFVQDRATNKQWAAQAALNMLRLRLDDGE
ncbi:MAG: competence/damage-inducible protein A [Firmicutes bacterium]|nr:competence/damage-inducible protein A [Bacillota bacterium]